MPWHCRPRSWLDQRPAQSGPSESAYGRCQRSPLRTVSRFFSSPIRCPVSTATDSSRRFRLVHGPSAGSLLSLGEPEPFLYRLTTCVPRMPFRRPPRAGGDHTPTGGAAHARDTCLAPARALLCRDPPWRLRYPARQPHRLTGSPPSSGLGSDLRESSARRSRHFDDAIGGSGPGRSDRLPGKWTIRIRVVRALQAPALRTAPTAGRRVFHRDAPPVSRPD